MTCFGVPKNLSTAMITLAFAEKLREYMKVAVMFLVGRRRPNQVTKHSFPGPLALFFSKYQRVKQCGKLLALCPHFRGSGG